VSCLVLIELLSYLAQIRLRLNPLSLHQKLCYVETAMQKTFLKRNRPRMVRTIRGSPCRLVTGTVLPDPWSGRIVGFVITPDPQRLKWPQPPCFNMSHNNLERRK
jgi:hypothetical protein